ncbi:hypothetical protein RSAG8_07207, partial [Rhizoctonia solani AG-8 WAC10335]
MATPSNSSTMQSGEQNADSGGMDSRAAGVLGNERVHNAAKQSTDEAYNADDILPHSLEGIFPSRKKDEKEGHGGGMEGLTGLLSLNSELATTQQQATFSSSLSPTRHDASVMTT